MTPKELLKNLGYDDDVIVKILEWYNNSLPETLNYYIEKTFNYFIKKGYTKDEIIKMTKTLPALFCLSEENIEEKLNFYNDINLSLIAINDTKKLMQSVELSYARYMYFEERGITIDESNYIRLFYNNKKFTKQYGITKEELFEKYKYDDEKRKKVK